MENNNFNTVDEIEQDLAGGPTPEKQELAEYEKLLIAEKNRMDLEHAKNLIKYGCFKQYDDPSFDFEAMELIDTPKLYKGSYRLYRSLVDFHLYFVCPLVEDNKGDAEAEKKDLKPYSYNVIAIEYMDNETYKMVIKAAKNNIGNAVTRLYTATIVLYCVSIFLALYVIIFNLITNASAYDFGNNFMLSFYYAGPYMIIVSVLTPIIGIFSMLYSKYKKEN